MALAELGDRARAGGRAEPWVEYRSESSMWRE